MNRIPNIGSPLIESNPALRVPALPMSPIWFRFFEQMARAATPVISSAVGNQTINASAGRFQVAAAATAVTITNDRVAASSVVLCTVASNDATARVNNVVPAAGGFTVNLTAPTAQTAIAFFVAA